MSKALLHGSHGWARGGGEGKEEKKKHKKNGNQEHHRRRRWKWWKKQRQHQKTDRTNQQSHLGTPEKTAAGHYFVRKFSVSSMCQVLWVEGGGGARRGNRCG